jgi:hypothetical protein
MSEMQHLIKAPASQEDVDDEKAEVVASYIAAGVEEIGVNDNACIKSNSSIPTIAPLLPHPLQTSSIPILDAPSGAALTIMDGRGMCAWQEAN